MNKDEMLDQLRQAHAAIGEAWWIAEQGSKLELRLDNIQMAVESVLAEVEGAGR